MVKAGTTLGIVTSVDAEAINDLSEKEEKYLAQHQLPSHLEDLFNRSVEHLGEQHHSKVCKLLREFQDVFAKDDMDLGRTNYTKHSIETGDTRPIRHRPRRAPRVHQEEIDSQVEKMLEQNIIVPSDSPWSSPVVLVKKKDGSQRFCVDYRKLNAASVKDAYPLPRIDDSLDALSGAMYFATLDLASGYWQLELDEDAKLKSAF